jgi:hypothetical protein
MGGGIFRPPGPGRCSCLWRRWRATGAVPSPVRGAVAGPWLIGIVARDAQQALALAPTALEHGAAMSSPRSVVLCLAVAEGSRGSPGSVRSRPRRALHPGCRGLPCLPACLDRPPAAARAIAPWSGPRLLSLFARTGSAVLSRIRRGFHPHQQVPGREELPDASPGRYNRHRRLFLRCGADPPRCGADPPSSALSAESSPRSLAAVSPPRQRAVDGVSSPSALSIGRNRGERVRDPGLGS